MIEEAGVSVRIYEREAGSLLYRETRDAEGGKSRKSLGHRDRQLAEEQARALARRVAELRYAGQTGTLRLGQLVALYLAERAPLLTVKRQRTVRGYAALLEHYFGRDFPVEDLSQHQVDAYAAARRSGTLVSYRHRRPTPGVRAGTIRNELLLLTVMLRWARAYRRGGQRLLTADPMAGIVLPREKNARRPVATHERYTKLLEVADAVDSLGRFRCILVLARYTGRRINAICRLRASDVLLSRDQVIRALGAAGLDTAHADAWPFGAVRWSADNDKLGYETVTPIGREARDGLERYLREHPRVGDVPLFPARQFPGEQMHMVTAGYWLKKAEEQAQLPEMELGAWHAFRRLWATERRHLPAQDVAAAGGWRSLEVMRAVYQHADARGVQSAVSLVSEEVPEARESEAG